MDKAIIRALPSKVRNELQKSVFRRLESHTLDVITGEISSELKHNIFVFSLFDSLPKYASTDKVANDKLIANLRHLLKIALTYHDVSKVSDVVKSKTTTHTEGKPKQGTTPKPSAPQQKSSKLKISKSVSGKLCETWAPPTQPSLNVQPAVQLEIPSTSMVIETVDTEETSSETAATDINSEELHPLPEVSTKTKPRRKRRPNGDDTSNPAFPQNAKVFLRVENPDDNPSPVDVWKSAYLQVANLAEHDIDLEWCRLPPSMLGVNCRAKAIAECSKCIRVMLMQPVTDCKVKKCQRRCKHELFPHGRSGSDCLHGLDDIEAGFRVLGESMTTRECLPSLLYVRLHCPSDPKYHVKKMREELDPYISYIQKEYKKIKDTS